jgi:acyl carrier protein
LCRRRIPRPGPTSFTLMRSEFDRIANRIRAFLVERHPASRRDIEQLGPATPLWGVISSMTLLELVDFIEAGFRIEVRPLDFVPENFATLECITRFIVDRTGAT